jgi:hypothetical protein
MISMMNKSAEGKKWRKNRQKKGTREDPKNDQKMEPCTGGEKPRSGATQGAFITRSVWCTRIKVRQTKKKKQQHWSRHVECKRSECEALSDSCAAYPAWDKFHTYTWDSWKQARASLRVRAGITKSPGGVFLMWSFMMSHRTASHHPTDHNTPTQTW